jgi:tetratricopeptide (TPR) repeat protein
LTPTAALRADLDRTHTPVADGAPGARDDDFASWTIVATVLTRLAAVPAAQWPRHAARAARALPARSAGLARALRASARGRATLAAVCDAARAVVEDMERGGALALARSSLVAVAALAQQDGAGAHGTTLAHLGRVVRQDGDLDAAESLYEAAAERAAAAGDDVLAARAAVGRGVIFGQRGNFPAARAAYTHALTLAPPGNPIAAGAHHGLMLVALAAGDLQTALGHGWRAFADASEDADRRADALSNLGGLCRRAGDHDAALRAFRASIALTETPRHRLTALRNAALSAAQGARSDLVAEFARDADVAMARVGQPYEVARAQLDLGEAYATLGDVAEAGTRLHDARAIAERYGYHELAWRVEVVTAAAQRAPADARRRPAADRPVPGAEAWTVVRQVRGLPLAAAELLALR